MQYPRIEQSGCMNLFENVFSIDLCKQNFTKVVDERFLGQQWDFESDHVIKQSVDAAYLK